MAESPGAGESGGSGATQGFVLGVTGGIGSGKSLLCALLHESHGLPVIDADRIGHEALEPGTPTFGRIVRRFGREILAPGGTIDRRRLGQIVFGDPEALAALNGISHPWIVGRIRDEVARLKGSGGAGIMLVDAALLLDWIDRFRPDGIALVTASMERRLERLERRGLSREEAMRRIVRQIAPPPGWADWTVENDGTLQELRQKAEELHRAVTERARTGQRRNGR